MDDCTVAAPTAQHTHTIIFLHGRGSTAKEFESEFFESESNDKTLPQIYPQVKWVFPNAHLLRAARFGEDIPQWFEMWSTNNPHDREDEQNQGIDSAVSTVLRIIEAEAAIVGSHQKVILAGISQGCAVAVHAMLKQELQLGGFIGLSSWIPNKASLVRTTQTAQRTPVFLSHSRDDKTIKIKYGEELRDGLKEIGMDVEWHAYKDGGHWVNEPSGVGEYNAFPNSGLADSSSGILKVVQSEIEQDRPHRACTFSKRLN